jgi:probable HAF family extracellular repeat protein
MTSLRYITMALVLIGCASLSQAQSTPDALNLTFTTIDVPGAVVTNVLGINTAGDVVGTYTTSSNGPGHGFLYSGGNFTLFDYPGASSTLAFGINDSGLISGTAYIKNGTAAVSFLYNGTTFTTVRAPGDSATLAHGINNAGVVVGGDGVSISGTKGFALLGERFTTVSPPGVYVYVFGNGVNNLNQIVGTDDFGAFFYNKGKYRTVSFPSASQTQAWGINDSGAIAGWYQGCSPSCADHAFVFMKGRYLSFDYAGAIGTFADGINASGQVVGSYTPDGQTYHGFITSPVTLVEFP